MLAGRGPLLLPVPDLASGEPPAANETPSLRDVCGVAVGTSGSTGEPKRAVLTSTALRASIEATHERLGGAGPWLLALPAHHIAGLQVILRSLAADADPRVVPPQAPFPAAFTQAAEQLNKFARSWYTSLVPAQLGPLLDDPAATRALARAAAVLVGGSALPQRWHQRALQAGIALATTYGMSETAGGCVYDGLPLAGAAARIKDGRIQLRGPMLAAGYLDDPQRSARAFPLDADGTRWFTSDDLGEITTDGRLIVHGRADEVINTGGYKVHPRLVEAALADTLPDNVGLAVVGIPHPRWGQAVVAALAPPQESIGAHTPPTDLTGAVRAALRQRLPRYAVPRLVVRLPQFPTLGPGKPDRAALAAQLAEFARHAGWADATAEAAANGAYPPTDTDTALGNDTDPGTTGSDR